MTQAISLNELRYDAAVERLRASAAALTAKRPDLPDLPGTSTAQDAFLERAKSLQGVLESYQRVLLEDVNEYRRIASVLKEADERSARSLAEVLGGGR